MSEYTRTWRVVALLAAYVVALQALLLPLSVAAGSPFKTSFCAATNSVGGAPAGHDSGCPCAAGCGTQCCVQTLASPPQAVAVKLGLTCVIATASVRATVPVIRVADRHPQVPRAPPRA